MRNRFVSLLRSVAAVVGGYLTVALGTILTFNVLVGQLTVDSRPLQLILGTIGAALSGLAGGLVAGIVAPRFPFAHAAGILILLVIDTASVIAKGPGPIWFDLAGSSVLAITVLIGDGSSQVDVKAKWHRVLRFESGSCALTKRDRSRCRTIEIG